VIKPVVGVSRSTEETKRACQPSHQTLFQQTPNRCWADDITTIRTTAGWRHLAVWIDLFRRRVVGRALDCRMDAVLVIEALNDALGDRQEEPE
jgi:transposase InsO family protein